MDMVMDRMICYDEATKKHLGSVKNKKVKRRKRHEKENRELSFSCIYGCRYV